MSFFQRCGCGPAVWLLVIWMQQMVTSNGFVHRSNLPTIQTPTLTLSSSSSSSSSISTHANRIQALPIHHHHHHHRHRHLNHRHPPHHYRSILSMSSSSSSSSSPDANELAQQKFETIKSLSDFNDGVWKGSATAYIVKSDVAAGVTKLPTLAHYESVCATSLEQNGLSLTETFSWDSESTSKSNSNDDNDDDNDDNDDDGYDNNEEKGEENVMTKMTTRTIPLGESTDVDNVDGSYSLDIPSPLSDLPPSSITGTDAIVKFAIEHSLAISDHERVRMFVLYGLDDYLMRVVICNEERPRNNPMNPNENNKEGESSSSSSSSSSFSNDFSLKDLDGMSVDMDRIISQMTGETQSKSNKPKVTSSSTAEDKMEQLMRAMEVRNQDILSQNNNMGNDNVNDNDNDNDNDNGASKEDMEELSIDRYPMSLFNLVSGVWLGDAVVRNHPTSSSSINQSQSTKGFGKASTSSSTSTSTSAKGSPKPGSGMNDGFAEWDTGVQKLAMTYQWDYDTKVRQRFDVGRSMGVSIHPEQPMISNGSIITNYMARGKDPEERMTTIDLEYGNYVMFVSGSIMVNVPRVLSVGTKNTNNKKNKIDGPPFYTEFAMFQKRTSKQQEQKEVESMRKLNLPDDPLSNENIPNMNITPPELFCSRLTRLYGRNGALSQATSSFFTMDRSTMK